MALFLRAVVGLLFFGHHVVVALFDKSAGSEKAASATPLKQRLPFYHSSDELRMALQDAAVACKTASATMESRRSQDGDVSLDVISIRGSKSGNAGTKEKQKALLVFGVHARELVSSESALHFVKGICGLGSIPEGDASKTLASTDFVIVPNANPRGRELVDSGHFCKRTNENGVDLNRNWDDHHVSASDGASDDDDRDGAQEENPGPSGFSEPETQILRDLARDVSPRLFLSIHSGAYMLGMPFGFTFSEQPEHANEMVNMLSGISNRYCGGRCPFGSLAQTIGYESKGCSIDYLVEQQKVPFAFIWEIYTDSKHMGKFTTEAKDDAADGRSSHTEKGFWDHFTPSKDWKKAQMADATSMQSSASAVSDPDEDCMRRFNPMTEGELNDVTDIWTQAYLDVANQVAAVPASVAQGTAQDASKASSSDSLGQVKTHGFSQAGEAPADVAKSVPAQSDEAFKPASAAEYVELMREQSQRANDRTSRQAEEHAAPDDDEVDKLSATVPSWDALKPGGNGGKWDFLKSHLPAV